MIKKPNVFLALFFLLITPLLYAKQKVSLIIVTENLPPFQMKENGKITGFATEIIQAAIKNTPYEANFQLYPWSRAYNLAQKKENTCVYSIARTVEREKIFQWTGVIAQTNANFIGLKTSNHIKIKSLKEAKNYITAVIKDDYTHHLLLQNGFKEYKHFYVVNNPDSLLKLLVARKNIDLILVDWLTIFYRAKVNQIDPELFHSFVQLNTKPLNFYLACSNNTSPKIIANLSQAIKKIKATGEYQQIIDKWLNKDEFLTTN